MNWRALIAKAGLWLLHRAEEEGVKEAQKWIDKKVAAGEAPPPQPPAAGQ